MGFELAEEKQKQSRRPQRGQWTRVEKHNATRDSYVAPPPKPTMTQRRNAFGQDADGNRDDVLLADGVALEERKEGARRRAEEEMLDVDAL